MQLLEPVAAIAPSRHVGRELAAKIRSRSANLGVIGLGHAGLHVALAMADNGFRVTGIDIDGSKVDSINAGTSYITDIQDESLSVAVCSGSLRATQSFASVEFLDAISICVPTPLRKTKHPDLAYMMAAVEAVHNHLKPGKLIVLESTTYPGITRQTVLPVLEKSGLKVGRDFFLAYAPKRLAPAGNTTFTMREIPKIIGGVTPRCTALTTLLYRHFIERIIPVSSSESAEMVRFLENAFRTVNIALANEIARMCLNFGANIWEVIEAAKSKPFDFMPFYPGPWSGEDRIAIDPNYFNWKAKMGGFEPRLFEVAGIINGQMPAFTLSRITDALNKSRKSLNGSHILVLGIAHTRDTDRIRESSCIEIIRALAEKGAFVSYSDPHVLAVDVDGKRLTSARTTPDVLSAADCVVILTDHSAFDYPAIVAHSRLILDCRNALRKYRADNVIAF